MNETPQIQSTTSYKQFSYLSGNRGIKASHLQNLIDSIQKRNLLHLNPIIVDSNMNIYDGQHRLEAAKTLKTPIYYVVGTDVQLNDIMLLNANMKNWSMAEYLDAWADRGKEAYKEVKKFIKKYDATIANSLAMLSADGLSKSFGAPFSTFKAGKFQVVDMEVANDLASFWLQVRPFVEKNAHNHRELLRALYHITLMENVDRDQLVERIEEHTENVPRLSSTIDYLRWFEDVYNHHRHIRTRLY